MFNTGRRGRERTDIWPGFVDALATLLLVFVFMLTVFMTAQLYMSHALGDREDALARLQSDLEELSEMLALERRERQEVEEALEAARAQLVATLAERDLLAEEAERLEEETARLEARRDFLEEEIAERAGELAEREARLAEREAELAEAREALEEEREARLAVEGDLEEQRRLTQRQEDQIEALRRDLLALREQLTAVSQALDIERATAAAQRVEIEDLGQRLNIALAERVQELEQYRSEFFGRLRDILGDRDDITVDGDRFRFQSELFFATASASIGPEGREQLDHLAETILEIEEEIPDEIDWVLQVEGHTDRRPISTPQFPSNWELSTARAQAIVHYLIDRGVPAHRLAATGYGEYHPLDPADNAEAYARNRRIELRLTNP